MPWSESLRSPPSTEWYVTPRPPRTPDRGGRCVCSLSLPAWPRAHAGCHFHRPERPCRLDGPPRQHWGTARACARSRTDALLPLDRASPLTACDCAQHPEVEATLSRAFELCAAAGVPAGSMSGDVATCRRMMEKGASFVGVGTDLMLLSSAVRSVCSRIAERPES